MAEKIDLNEADVTVLASLSGISEGLAAGIVEYRETVRPFTEVTELTAVPGISEQMVREIEAQVTVGDVIESEMAEAVDEPVEDVAEEDMLEEDAVEEIEPVGKTAVSPIITEVEEPVSAPPANSGFRGQAYTAIIGALIGTFLTLAVLSLLNGSLRLNQSAQVRDLERQYAESVATMQAGQTAARADLDALTEQVDAMAVREDETAVLLETIQTNLADTTVKTDALQTSTDERLATVVANAADLEAATVDLDERLTAVAASAENFDTFLNGLRELLVALQEPSSPLTSTTTLTTTTTLTPTVTPTLTATPAPPTTAAPLPTRTPRPTATPLGEAAPTALPTVTPTE